MIKPRKIFRTVLATTIFVSFIFIGCGGVNTPTAPSAFQATAISRTQIIELSWKDNSGNEDGFKIERKTGEEGTYVQIGIVGAGVVSYSDIGANCSTTYLYRILAYNVAGTSDYSNEASISTQVCIPDIPSNLQATVVSSSQIDLTWADDSDNETGFKIERKDGIGDSWSEITQVAANVTDYSDTSLTCKKTYFYRVRSFNTSGDSYHSNQASATSGTPCLASQVSSGAGSTCALFSSGRVNCWGGGIGMERIEEYPVDVSDLAGGVAAISVGYQHTCALTSAGGVKCWGRNVYGQLGDGTNTDRNIPVDASGLTSGVIAVSAGVEHTCAILNSGGVKCWGANFYGELGDGGTETYKNTPLEIPGLTSGATAVSAGYRHTCALLNSGGIKCWGANYDGALGEGATEMTKNIPVDVSGLTSSVIAISAGLDHTCVLAIGGGVKCLGNNFYGQLGNGTKMDSNIPVNVIGIGP